MDQPVPHQLPEDVALEAGRQLCELSAHVQAGLAEFALQAAARQHREQGLAIGPTTPVAAWGGEGGDLHYVADVFDEAAHRARARASP